MIKTFHGKKETRNRLQLEKNRGRGDKKIDSDNFFGRHSGNGKYRNPGYFTNEYSLFKDQEFSRETYLGEMLDRK